jgi:hypothetical protein
MERTLMNCPPFLENSVICGWFYILSPVSHRETPSLHLMPSTEGFKVGITFVSPFTSHTMWELEHEVGGLVHFRGRRSV